MKFSEQSKASVISCIKEAISRYMGGSEENQVVTDIHLQPRQDSGELIIYNDDDGELSRAIVEDWVDYDEDDFDTEVERILRNVLNEMKSGGAFDDLNIMKPYSFVYVEDEKESITELLVMDENDTVVIDEELMKGLDEDLDRFLDDLMKK